MSSPVDTLASILLKDALPALTGELQELGTKADTEWKQSLLGVATTLVTKHGPSGIDALKNLTNSIINGTTPDMSKLTLREASEVLAILQRLEAEDRKAASAFLSTVLESLSKVAAILLTSLLKAI
jgi:hypothetical protein